MAKGVVIQASFYEAMRILPDTERLALYDAICGYGINGEEPQDLPPTIAGYFALMRPNIDSSIRRYNASVANGRNGGAPKGNQNASKKKSAKEILLKFGEITMEVQDDEKE